jgi:hypothetical protein
MSQQAQHPSAEMTDDQFRQHALGILERELGATGLARFVRVYGRAYGDYTRERRTWQKGTTVAQIAAEIKARRKQSA